MKMTGRCFSILGCIALNIAVANVSHAFDKPEYDDCLLQHLKGAKLDAAAQLITKACDDNIRNAFTSSTQRKYNDCLLENLVGVESMVAMNQITHVCYRKSTE